MKNSEYMNSMQAVDIAVGNNFLIPMFEQIAVPAERTKGEPTPLRRFLADPKKQIYFTANNDIQTMLNKITARENDKGGKGIDLPCCIYYREFGFNKEDKQYIQIWDKTWFKNTEYIEGTDDAARVTVMPLAFQYKVGFMGWDRATVEQMTIAMWGYLAPLFRQHSRFMVPQLIGGERIDVPANISTPRDIMSNAESLEIGEGTRLWGMSATLEVTTQILYGHTFKMQDYFRVCGEPRFIEYSNIEINEA